MYAWGHAVEQIIVRKIQSRPLFCGAKPHAEHAAAPRQAVNVHAPVHGGPHLDSREIGRLQGPVHYLS